MQKIALASASPRRRELLAQLAVNFELVKAEVDETQLPGEIATDYVLRLAISKARAGFQVQTQTATEVLPVLGADTIVVVDGEVLGKPTDQADFLRMMRLLSGRQHQVYTAIALVSGDLVNGELVTGERVLSDTVKTEVWFSALTEAQMLDYWRSGEPADKAGGYGIQGLASRFIPKIAGSYFAVVGLPLYETDQLLQQL
ncbi:septum formation inhibitor Maf [Rheinheimera riviphila]|uniref:dTTP/UTP pyrophosphatase n=1 Tax=Rheinheimera riviphila TaxID=1834037 RepID=A0A437QF79_9GAMM|nr:Maf family protein [Rheinheimera riviphila]RVU33073.1 septum formation inhibitor Maf [Rheinheimera riviphila]